MSFFQGASRSRREWMQAPLLFKNEKVGPDPIRGNEDRQRLFVHVSCVKMSAFLYRSKEMVKTGIAKHL